MSAGAVIGIVLGAVAVFSAGPALTMILRIFLRNDVSSRAFDRYYFDPYRDEIAAALAFYDALTPRMIETVSADGTRLCGTYYDGGFSRTVIFLHGYRGTPMSNFWYHGRLFYRRGFNLLFVDERAHGRSGGGFSSLGLKERDDVLAWLSWAEENLKGQELLVYGTSMGCVAASFASEELEPGALRAMVLDCGYTSVAEVLRYDCRRWNMPPFLVVPWMKLYGRLFFRVDLTRDVRENLAKCRVPALFFHGLADTAVPPAETEKNYHACAAEKKLFTVPGAEHTMSLVVGGEEAERILFSFISKYFSEPIKETLT